MKILKNIFATDLTKSLVGNNVTVGGWIEDFRDIGKIGFLKVRDITGVMQAVVSGESLNIAKEIPRQSSVIIDGIVQDTKSESLDVEIKVGCLILVGKALHPLPIDPTGRIESSYDKKLDSRALDLRNPRISSIFKIRSYALKNIREILYSKRFIEVNTPKIIGSATEGGANLFSFDYFKKKGYLAQSPQLFKEQLTLGLERIFEIGPYFRAEPSHTSRHLSEFISVDFEAAFLDYTEIMGIVEELIRSTISCIRESASKELEILGSNINKLNNTIPKISYEKCLEELSSVGDKLKFGDDLSDSALKKLGEIHDGFYFIIDWPTKLKPFYILEHDDRPEISKSFDLQHGYLELVSGGRREHDPSLLKKKMIDQNLNPNNFADHLKAFEWGMPPHSGCGLGFDRFMMTLTGINNIREVVLYPRDSDRLNP